MFSIVKNNRDFNLAKRIKILIILSINQKKIIIQMHIKKYIYIIIIDRESLFRQYQKIDKNDFPIGFLNSIITQENLKGEDI